MRNEDTIFTAIVALVAMDIISDILFLTAMLNDTEGVDEQDNTETEVNPLIGRRYIVKDNSYATDKATGVSVTNLHGKEYIIVGEPFVKGEHLMVTIFSTDSEREYNVLFQENCIVAE